MATRQDYIDYARKVASANGLNPDIFVAQIQQESGFNPKAGSYAGAQGIAQIVPKYHPSMKGKTDDPFASLDYAANLMSSNLKKYGGDYRLALAAYNGGDGAANFLKKNPRFLENPDKKASRDSWQNQSADYQKIILANANAKPVVGMDVGAAPQRDASQTQLAYAAEPIVDPAVAAREQIKQQEAAQKSPEDSIAQQADAANAYSDSLKVVDAPTQRNYQKEYQAQLAKAFGEAPDMGDQFSPELDSYIRSVFDQA